MRGLDELWSRSSTAEKISETECLQRSMIDKGRRIGMGKKFEIKDLANALGLQIEDDRRSTQLIVLASALGVVALTEQDREPSRRARRLLGELTKKPSDEMIQRLAKKFGAKITAGFEWLEVCKHLQDRPTALPAPVWAACLVSIVLAAPGKNKRAWDFIDMLFEELGDDINSSGVSDLRDWLLGNADSSYNERMSGYFPSALAKSHIPDDFHAFVRQGARARVKDYYQTKDNVLAVLDTLRPDLDALYISQHTIADIEKYLKNDRFHLSVMGEFKRGKSTLINALLGKPGLMPTHILPCTSGLTSIQHGEPDSYEVSHKKGFEGTYKSVGQEDFKQGVSQAQDKKNRTRKKGDASAAADLVPYWRVQTSSKFLKDYNVSLIDSPGLGEDYARDEITRREAVRTDCAILVFDVEQLASNRELELIDEMGARIENLFIALNKADRLPGGVETQEQMLEHVLERVPDGVKKEHIFFLSARSAEQALENNTDNKWVNELDTFKAAIGKHLSQQSGAIKTQKLKAKADHFINSAIEEANNSLETMRLTWEEGKNLEVDRKSSKEGYEKAKNAVAAGKNALDRHDRMFNRLNRAFLSALSDTIIPQATATLEGAKIEYNALTSPKKYANDAGRIMQEELVKEIKTWFQGKGKDIITAEVEKLQNDLVAQTAEFRAYVMKSTGRQEDALKAELNHSMISSAFGDNYSPGTGEIVRDTMLAGAVAAIVGYIIADIILYYILSLISGFLNPLLLAGAAVVAVGAMFFGGPSVLGKKMKKLIADKVKEELTKTGETQTEILVALENATKDVTRKLSLGFEESAKSMLKEIRTQQKRREKEIERFQKEHGGTATELRARLAETEERITIFKQKLGKLRDIFEIA